MARLTGCGKADRSTLHAMDTEEHDKVFSRTLGRMVEIGVNKVGGNLVPANPFASEAQRGYMHAHSQSDHTTVTERANRSFKANQTLINHDQESHIPVHLSQ